MKTSATILLLLIFLCGSFLFGQDSTKCISKFDTTQQRVIYTQVDSMPQFPGGNDSLWSFIVKNLEYPHHLPNSLRIYVVFTIENTGQTTNLRIYKGGYEPANKEVLRVFKQMPNWIPGSCEGEVVPVQVVIPINFEIQR